ncbi:hypothetical protein A3L09_09250 [Thermococcus profundus]|uniref:Uncharacterized protein n=1 Tax=Thermococcus profundus TaxID=49899 RepID=A0A2Z2MD06_THEPR|nr:hypothetical protein [Thermococcus profundus]ASJ03433.1 hypothetical protein A3L09_09250 [Thermococcus profundus]
MSEARLRKELFQRVKELSEEIREGLNYGIPHLVGEISAGSNGSLQLEVNVALFSKSAHRFLLKEEDSLLFMLPLDDYNPRRVFLELWSFLNGRSKGNALEPGTSIKGVLKTSLQRRGFEVVWMNVSGDESGGYVEAIASKAGQRYRMLFERKSPDEFILVDMEKI